MIPTENKLSTLDLFAGIGGFAYGLEKTGKYEVKAFCEWDSKCQQVLRKHWPDVQCFSDVSTLEGMPGSVRYCYSRSSCEAYNLYVEREIDFITGGFPCQDVSSANFSAEGITGKKSSLWSEYARLISEIKPKGVIIENVSKLTSRGLDRVLYDLAKIGYDAEWYTLRASDFGACHRRERVFILAHPSSIGFKNALSLEEAFAKGQELHSQRDLQAVCNNPFGRSGSVPKPLLRGMDDGLAGWMDRCKQLGNSVYWPIVSALGEHMYDNIKRSSLRH